MWLHTSILTLLFFLISLGLGLFVLAFASIALLRRSRLTRLQLIALGFIIGAPGTGTFLQLLSLVSTDLRLDLTLLIIVSLLGFLITRSLWRPRRQDWKEIALWAAISFSAASFTWWWSFGAFSSFPFGDIGADVHWIKTAREFADTGVINPYANQSYVDLRSALAGLLAGTSDLDLLRFNWIYRYFSILYLLMCYYAVADSLFADASRKWFAFFFAAAGNVIGLLTNGSLALIGSFVFLSALLRTRDTATSQRILSAPALLPAAAGFFGLVLAYLVNNNTLMLASLLLVLALLNILNRMRGPASNMASCAFVSGAWSMSLMFAHRGSYLFVPIAITSWLFHIALSNIVSEGTARSLRAPQLTAVVLPCICIAILAWVTGARLGYLPAMNANNLFSYVTLALLGRAIKNGDEITLGAGPDIAAIEIGRAIGPFFAIGIGLIFLWWCIGNNLARMPRDCPRHRAGTTRLLWSWIAGCTLCVVALSGFPFLYRVVFIISGFLAIAMTELFHQLFVDPVPDASKQRRLIAGMGAISIAALVVGLYAFSWGADHPYNGYQAVLRPAQLACLVLVLLFAALTLSRSRRIQVAALAAVISLGVAIDRCGTSTLFMVYSYGRLPGNTSIVSHYDASDLKANRWLHDHMREALIISDPYTLGMAKAITGAPGMYLFSNLDTVNRATAGRAKAVISAISEHAGDKTDTARKTCAFISPLLADLNQEALVRINQADRDLGIWRPVRPALEEGDRTSDITGTPDVMRGWNNILRKPGASGTPGIKGPDFKNEGAGSADTAQTERWNVVAEINPRTIRWLHLGEGQRLSYYPIDETLDRKTLDSLNSGPFRVLFSDDQNVIVLIECTNAKARLDDAS